VKKNLIQTIWKIQRNVTGALLNDGYVDLAGWLFGFFEQEG